MAHVRQARPDYGLDSQLKVLKAFQVVPSSLGSGGLRVEGPGGRVQGLGLRFLSDRLGWGESYSDEYS